MTVTQTSPRAAINWLGFNIGQNASVHFEQPSSSSVILNRVVGNERSVIDGTLRANGQVFLINPNGVYIGSGSRVDVGALLASTRNLNDPDFLAGRITLIGSGAGAVHNSGQINASDNGYVALIGRSVRNDGLINARLGTVAAVAGDRVSLNFNSNSLVGVSIERGTLEALVANGGAVRADGGQILLTARAADGLVDAVVNNSGELRARTIEQRDGRIVLQADLAQGQALVGGILDASAPDGGKGGFIETSGAKVNVQPGTQVTTLAISGQTGQWLLDPSDFSINEGAGTLTNSSIGASTLAASLANSNVSLSTNAAGNGSGDIRVLSPVSWNAPTRLTLSAHADIVIGADITAQHANGSVQLEVGQGALAAGNTSTYRFTNDARVNLQAGDNFYTRLGSDGALEGWRVITQLGSAGSGSGSDLQGIAGRLDGRFALGADINASDTASWNGGAGFEPLGIWGNGFTGRFDGLGHNISHLTIHRPDLGQVGLFGVADGGSIRHVRLADAAIAGTSAVGALVGSGNNGLVIDDAHVTGTVTGLDSVGGVAGALAGQVRSSSSTATVSGRNFIGGVTGYLEGDIAHSSATGNVSGDFSVGGLAGQANAIRASSASGTVNATGNAAGGLAGTAIEVSDSSASGNVSAVGNYVGGLVGHANRISGSSASGAVNGHEHVGGLAGNLAGEVTHSSASGNVTATGDVVGGLVGYADTIAGSWASGHVSGNNFVGGVAGFVQTSVTGVAGVTTARGHVSGANFVGGLAGQAAVISNASASGTVSATGGNVGGLAGVATEITNSSATGNVTAAGDVVGGLVGYADTIAGSWANGHVSGNNHVGGLAGFVQTSLTGVAGVTTAQGNVGGANYVGGLVGQAAAIGNASASGRVSASGSNVGGLAGAATEITHSAATGNVTATGDTVGGLVGYADRIIGSTASGAVIGNNRVGGLVGYVSADLTGSSASGAVYATGGDAGGLAGIAAEVTSSFATGNVTAAGDVVGGLTGYANTITGSWASGDVNGNSYVGGLAGFVQTSITGVAGVTTAQGNVSGANYVGGLVGQAAAVSNASASGRVGATGSDVGGLAGQATEITHSAATGNVTATGDYVGGLVGNATRIIGSTASGAVSGNNRVGGLVGHLYADLTGSSASGTVYGTGSNVGGLAGVAAEVTSSFATGNVTAAGDVVGGLVGYADTIAGSLASGQVSGNNFVGGLAGFVQTSVTGVAGVTTARGNVSGAYSVGGLVGQAAVISNASASGTVSATGGNVGGLAGVATEITNSVATGNVTANGDAVGGLVGYANRISGSMATGAVNGISYVGGLVGHLLGDVENSTASGHVSATGSLIGGLVGWGNNVIDSSASGNVSGDSYVGGLAGQVGERITRGQASGTILGSGGTVGGLVGAANQVVDSRATGKVSAAGSVVGGLAGWVQDISGSQASGTVTGDGYVGGLVGQSIGKVSTSTAQGEVNGTGWYVGGLVGHADELVSLSSATGDVHGGMYSGGLVGLNTAAVTDSWAKGSVTGTGDFVGGLAGHANTVTGSWASGDVAGVNNVGGLVGRTTNITNASAMGSVMASGGYVGGLAGYADNITGSRASGHVSGNTYVGGLAGHVQTSVTGVAGVLTAQGNVSGTYTVGGLVGQATNIVNASASGHVTATGHQVGGLAGRANSIINSWASGDVSGISYVGGLVGSDICCSAPTVRDSWYTGSVKGSSEVGGLIGSAFDSINLMNSHYNLDAVRIYIDGVEQSAHVTLGGLYAPQYAAWVAGGRAALNPASYFKSDADGRWQLDSMNDLKNLLAFSYDNTKAFRLTRDIDISSTPGWNLPVLAGSLDGGYHLISGLQNLQAWNSNQGLIGFLSGSVRRLGVTGTVRGKEYVGGLAGVVSGSIDESYASVDVGGQYIVGGLAGQINENGALSNSYADGTVRGLPVLPGLPDAESPIGIGSLVGLSLGTLDRSYGAATVVCTADCYAAGGLVAAAFPSTTRSFSIVSRAGVNNWEGNVEYPSGDMGLDDASARQAETWVNAGWSIASTPGSSATWRIYDGLSLPLLRGFLNPLTVSGTAIKAYDATTTVNALSLGYSSTLDTAHVLGTATGITSTAGPGVQTMNLSGLYSDQQGYDIGYGLSQAIITPPVMDGLAEAVAAALRSARRTNEPSLFPLPGAVKSPLNEVPSGLAAAFPPGSNLSVVGVPRAGQQSQAIDMGVASRLTGQNPQGRTRLPVNRKLPLYSIDGGLQLPPQVDQLMFVVNE